MLHLRSEVHLTWKQPEQGAFVLHLITGKGQSMYTQNLWIDAKSPVAAFTVPAVPVGTYYVRLIHKKSGKGWTEKLIIW